MKNFGILLLTLLFAFKIQAQSNKTFSGNYFFKKSVIINSTQTEKDSERAIEIRRNRKVVVLDTGKSKVYYQYWNFKKDPVLIDKFNNRTFEMPFKDFVSLTGKIYSRYKGAAFGVYTIPFRLRGIADDFDFESSLSLQSNVVFGFGRRDKEESWFDASLGIGLSGVGLNNLNSDISEDTVRTASAFTISCGGVIKFAPEVNLGIFLGWDFLGLGDQDINWKYDKRTWLGLGLNVSYNQLKAGTDKITGSKKNKK